VNSLMAGRGSDADGAEDEMTTSPSWDAPVDRLRRPEARGEVDPRGSGERTLSVVSSRLQSHCNTAQPRSGGHVRAPAATGSPSPTRLWLSRLPATLISTVDGSVTPTGVTYDETGKATNRNLPPKDQTPSIHFLARTQGLP
jgi:hypothetical protein